MMDRNSIILVTGGAGFIGSNLCEYLLHAGYRVVCLDNFATGKPENIRQHFDNPAFRLVVGDIRNPEDCQKAVQGVDYVLHEAALGSVPRSMKDPATTNAVNISGFLNMLLLPGMRSEAFYLCSQFIHLRGFQEFAQSGRSHRTSAFSLCYYKICQ